MPYTDTFLPALAQFSTYLGGRAKENKKKYEDAVTSQALTIFNEKARQAKSLGEVSDAQTIAAKFAEDNGIDPGMATDILTKTLPQAAQHTARIKEDADEAYRQRESSKPTDAVGFDGSSVFYQQSQYSEKDHGMKTVMALRMDAATGKIFDGNKQITKEEAEAKGANYPKMIEALNEGKEKQATQARLAKQESDNDRQIYPFTNGDGIPTLASIDKKTGKMYVSDQGGWKQVDSFDGLFRGKGVLTDSQNPSDRMQGWSQQVKDLNSMRTQQEDQIFDKYVKYSSVTNNRDFRDKSKEFVIGQALRDEQFLSSYEGAEFKNSKQFMAAVEDQRTLASNAMVNDMTGKQVEQLKQWTAQNYKNGFGLKWDDLTETLKYKEYVKNIPAFKNTIVETKPIQWK